MERLSKSKILQHVVDDRLIGLENRITYLENAVEKLASDSYKRDTSQIRLMLRIASAMRINPDDLSRAGEIQNICHTLEKLLKKVSRREG